MDVLQRRRESKPFDYSWTHRIGSHTIFAPMRYVGVLAFADLIQIHLWVALALGMILRRRWRKTWPAVGVATALYCTATAVLSLIGWTPSGYLVVLLGATAAGWPSPADISRVRIYSLGIASVFALLCVLPTGAAWLLRRR